MNATDRPEFTSQLKLLCAGFNVPVGDREEAYWKGLANLSLPEFSRCVEYALGEAGPEKIPTTRQIWGIRKELRARRFSGPVEQQPAQPEIPYTKAEIMANELLIAFARWSCVRTPPPFQTVRRADGHGRVRADVTPEHERLARAMYAEAKVMARDYESHLMEPDSGFTDLMFFEAFCDRVVILVSPEMANAFRTWGQRLSRPSALARTPAEPREKAA